MTDTSDLEAMIQGAIQAELAQKSARGDSEWHSTLEEMLIHLSVPQNDRRGLLKEKCLISNNNLGKDITQKSWQEASYKGNNKLVKTIPPPAAIIINSSHLSERIESLQTKALVGRWHFSELDDAKMRCWLEQQ